MTNTAPSEEGDYAGQLRVVGEITWMWIGTKWRVVGKPVSSPDDAVPFSLIDAPLVKPPDQVG